MAKLNLHAEMTLYPTDRGGRKNPIKSGYRPTLCVVGDSPTSLPDLCSCVTYFNRWLEIQPGETFDAEIVPAAFKAWPVFPSDASFTIMEGENVVGDGHFVPNTLRAIAEKNVEPQMMLQPIKLGPRHKTGPLRKYQR